MYVLETLFHSASSKATFVGRYEPATTTLSIFSKIHDDYDEQVAAEAQAQHETSESEISDIEMSPEMIKAASYSSLIMEKVQVEGDSISRSFLNTT